MKEIERILADVAREHGSLANNLGDAAEETFYEGLEESKRLGDYEFETVARNVRDIDGHEYDIVMRNGSTVAVVEVKHKVHPKDVTQLVEKTIPAFKESFPQYKDYDIFGALAGMSFPTEVRESAERRGLYVLTQSGNNIKLSNRKDFEPKAL